MPAAVAFVEPSSLEEAVESLASYGGEARLVAGATALTIMLRQRLIRPSALISLNKIAGLNTIERRDGHLRIGALVTHRAVELNPLVRSTIPVLSQTFAKVANVRVRNAATVGGVLAEADYASDPPPVFLALDAEVEALGPRGARSIPISDFFKGFYETALQQDEIVTAISVPVPADGSRGVYEKYVTRSSEDRPCLGVIALSSTAADGTCRGLRVAVGAVAEVPQRFTEVEALASGTRLETDVAQRVADQYAERIDTLADMRGSAWYRTEMIRVWVRRAIEAVRVAQ